MDMDTTKTATDFVKPSHKKPSPHPHPKLVSAETQKCQVGHSRKKPKLMSAQDKNEEERAENREDRARERNSSDSEAKRRKIHATTTNQGTSSCTESRGMK